MSEAVETGIRWWLRYVVVPIIGGGGIVAIVVALIQKPREPAHPAQETSVSAASVPTSSPIQSLEFYATGGNSVGPQSESIEATDGQTVVFHWRVVRVSGGLMLVCDGKPPKRDNASHSLSKAEVEEAEKIDRYTIHLYKQEVDLPNSGASSLTGSDKDIVCTLMDSGTTDSNGRKIGQIKVISLPK
jgi:hypothetical protein